MTNSGNVGVLMATTDAQAGFQEIETLLPYNIAANTGAAPF